ncbi:MAG: endonuclease Q family protein, partial [Nitrospirota bacterium]|nr:endonuclease Q family protein [Nitrospirota bacterium]
SRATSREMCLESMHRWAQLKGITVLGTGDFTHPAWFNELKNKLEPAEPGLFRLKKELAATADTDVPESCRAEVRFMLSAEVSCIYRRADKTRKVHHLLYAPDLDAAARINADLARIGNIASDGRPILGLDSVRLLQFVLAASPDAHLIPAHAWTPHFSIFGSASGFDSMDECFGDLAPHIFAIETGLSSDPPMNRRLSALDGIALISNSDAHSPMKLGREANLFNTDLSYRAIFDAIKANDPARFTGTIEFFPEEGKYHMDGHRACNMRLAPTETIRNNGLCPSCGKPVTVGVMHRVEKLADRPEGKQPAGLLRHRPAVPLTEIISEVLDVGESSKAVAKEYAKLLATFGNEFAILLEIPLADISKGGFPLIADAIGKMRKGEVEVDPGYDGVFGRVRVKP